jgi:uncharacterized protein (TIGR00725 family)
MASSVPAPRRNVVVFGASWAQPGTPLYDASTALGCALATAGFGIVSGGYGGTMEGVSKGAREGGGEAIGVLVPNLFPDRMAEGNAHLSQQVNTPSLLSRIDAMLGLSQPRLIVALPGTLGTLTEICAAWNLAALAPVGGYAPFRVIAWRKPWEALLLACCDQLALAPEQRALLVFVDSVEEALAAVQAAAAS